MSKQKVISPRIARNIYMDVDLFTRMVLEYVGYLRSRVTNDDKGRLYCQREENDYNKCWRKTERFCKMLGLDCEVFMDALFEFDILSDCESCVATNFDPAAFFKKMDKLKEREGE